MMGKSWIDRGIVVTIALSISFASTADDRSTKNLSCIDQIVDAARSLATDRSHPSCTHGNYRVEVFKASFETLLLSFSETDWTEKKFSSRGESTVRARVIHGFSNRLNKITGAIQLHFEAIFPDWPRGFFTGSFILGLAVESELTEPFERHLKRVSNAVFNLLVDQKPAIPYFAFSGRACWGDNSGGRPFQGWIVVDPHGKQVGGALLIPNGGVEWTFSKGFSDASRTQPTTSKGRVWDSTGDELIEPR